jgi:hypothetical protein
MQKLARRTYSMLVELDSGQSASLLIVRDRDRVAAELRSFEPYLKQITCGDGMDFESADVWTLLALVEHGFRRIHGISYEYLPPRDVHRRSGRRDLSGVRMTRAISPSRRMTERGGLTASGSAICRQ